MYLSVETLDFIRLHNMEDVRILALQASRYPLVDMMTAIRQIAGWQIARHKIPAWAEKPDLLYAAHLSMEQCSIQQTAAYKRTLAQQLLPSGESMADLTAGLGVDCSFISQAFKQSAYVERQEVLCDIARHNFPVLGLNNIKIVQMDAVDYLKSMEPVEMLYLDPARRDSHGGKTVALGYCEPDVTLLEPLLMQKGRFVMINLSPMLDIHQAMNELKHVYQIHVLAVNNECKELLVVLHVGGSEPPII